MNFSLLDQIDRVRDGVLATVIGTEGRTYKKSGEKALFVVDDPLPVYGNLGSLCVEQDILRQGKEASTMALPRVIQIDTTDASDIHLGYGTYCGGKMEILLEPVLSEHKQVYRQLRSALERREASHLDHDLQAGHITIHDARPADRKNHYVETFPALTRLCIFGATPLAQQIASVVEGMDFEIHVIDWRETYIAAFRDVPYAVLHTDSYPFETDSLALIISHSYTRDKAALKEALSAGCAYVGLLSSTKRRDHLYDELVSEEIPRTALDTVSSPIGLDLKGRTDPEIAVSIVAELVRFKNQ